MFDSVNFTSGEVTYAITSQGLAEKTVDGAPVSGTWSTSAECGNQLKLTWGDGSTEVFPVAYAFESGTEDNQLYENLLRVQVKDDAGADLGSGLLYGTIKAEDQEDIEFVLNGVTVHIDCTLSLQGDYRALTVAFSDGTAQTKVIGEPHLTKNDSPSTDLENDLFEFAANSNIVDLDTEDLQNNKATIKLTGNVDFEQDHITFFGSHNSDGTMNVILAGRYKSVAGALQVVQEDDETNVLLNVAAQVDFEKSSMKFGLSLGYSSTGSKTLNGTVSYETDDDRTKITGTLAVEDQDGLTVNLELKGTVGLANGNSIEFKMESEYDGEALSVALGGTVTFQGGAVFEFGLQYGEDTTELTLELNDDDKSMFVQIVEDAGGEVQIGIGVTFTFAGAVDEPKAVLVA